jgi:hypothetical protein
MDREHPIPQEVSTYEFRLVGDMTIKQFMQVAAGALISLVLYSSNLAPYVKWPLIIISFLVGIALAFFPIEDRPLSKWIVLFVKAIYSPTIYLWDKNARRHEIFQPENGQFAMAVGATVPGAVPQTPQDVQQIQTMSAPPGSEDEVKLEKSEQEFLSKVNLQFITPTPTVSTTGSQIPSQTTQRVSKVILPGENAVKVEPPKKETVIPKPPEYQNQTQTGNNLQPIASQKLETAKSATFSQEASPPSPPTRPNVIVGQVLDPGGKIIDGAILEIKDSEGRSVRALRSNRLGHFMIVTPLVNGNYQIFTEKEGFLFDPVSFEAKDEIIPPIAIWAKG